MRPHLIPGRFFAVGLMGNLLLWGIASAYQGSEPDAVFRQADRELRQALVRAERAIEQGDFADAVDEIGKLLAENTTDDFFLLGNEAGEPRTSLKAEAERLLGNLPQRGRDLYELKFGTEARVLLEAALKDGSAVKLTEVVRRYFHTQAGVEAAILLGRLQLDRGHALSAALTFRRVLSVPGSASFDPELSLLLAVAWHQAQRPEDAKSVLTKLLAKGEVRVKGKETLPLQANDDPNAWLAKLAGIAKPRGERARVEWCLLGGDEQRNASVIGSRPLNDSRWRMVTVGDPNDKKHVHEIKARMKDANFGHLPSAQPLAINGSVLMRGAERMWAVDLPTGKIMWEYPWDETERDRQQRMGLASNIGPNREATRKQELQQRLWEDYAYGQLSSDGETVYELDEMRIVAPQNDRRIVVAGGRIIGPQMTVTHNQLVALELNKQGKLKWIVGGEKGNDEPKLTDHFFLGAPLPLMGQLLVLAERDGEIRLVVLDAASGKVDWSQQVAHMNEAGIRFDSVRRLAGATPSFAEGMVVCPTAGGAVVAVDWAKRSLAWGYSYKRTTVQITPQRFAFQFNVDPNQVSNPTRWTNSSAIIADEKVILTPPDSNELHCLDLVTGKPVWTPRERTNSLAGGMYVGCVHQGKAIVVTKKGVTAVNLNDGSDAWTLAFETNAFGPAGRGYYAQPYYWLPLANGELLKIDLLAGKIAEKTSTEMPLGNLIVHRGELISLGADFLSTYYLRDMVEAEADALLAKNAQDPWALARKGEIMLQDGKTGPGLDLLRTALKLQPEDEIARTRLLKSLLNSLQESDKAIVAEIEQLISTPSERADFLRKIADVHLIKGAQREAFETYLALASISAQLARQGRESQSMEELQPGWRVQSDRWLYSRLSALYAKADTETKRGLDAAVSQQISQPNLTPAQQQKIAALFAFHPETFRLKQTAAEKALTNKGYLAAELELSPLLRHAAPEARGVATATMAALTEKTQRNFEAAWWLQKLGTEFAAVKCTANETGKEVHAAAFARAALARELPSAWPQGRVDVNIDGETSSRIPSYQRLQPIQIMSQSGSMGPGQQAVLDTSRGAIIIRDPLGRPLGEFSLNREGGRSYYQMVNGALLGHLLILTTGTEVLALDTWQQTMGEVSRDAALWRYETAEQANRYGGYVQQRTVRNPFGRPRTVAYDQQNNPLSTAIAVGPWGVAFLRGRSLICVHPMSGEVMWERVGYTPGTDLIADDRLLFVIPHGSEQAQVLDAWDGSKQNDIRVPKFENRLYNHNGQLLSWSESASDIRLQLRNLATDQEIWAQAFAPGSHACPVGNDEIAVLQPNGQLVIVSLVDGRTRLHLKVEPEPTLTGLQVQRTQDRYYVLAGHPQTEPTPRVAFNAGLPTNAVLMTGRVYAFDRATRKPVWPAPVYIHQQGFILDQPAELPVLAFVRTANSSGAKSQTGLLCIDKRSGAVLIDKQDWPTTIHAFEMIGNREKNQVAVTLFGGSQRTFTLTFTEQPMPPAPPAQLGPMSSLSVGSQPGTGVNVAGAVIDAINRQVLPKADPFQDPFK